MNGDHCDDVRLFYGDDDDDGDDDACWSVFDVCDDDGDGDGFCGAFEDSLLQPAETVVVGAGAGAV